MISGVRSDSHAGYLSPRSAASVTRLDMAHSNSAGGNATTTSTRGQPGVGDRAPRPPAVTRAATSGWTTATPRSTAMTARLPRSVLAVAPEAGLPSLDPGQAVGVVGVVPVAHVVPARRVAHRPADAADGDGVGDLVDERALGDAPVVRLQAEHAREAGRDADGPAAVTPRRDGKQPSRHRRRRAARRPARRALEVPGVAGGAVQAGVGDVDAAELAGRRLAGQDRAGAAKSAHLRRGVGGDPVGVDERRFGERPTLDRLELLDPDGHATEGERHVGVCAPRAVPLRRRRG